MAHDVSLHQVDDVFGDVRGVVGNPFQVATDREVAQEAFDVVRVSADGGREFLE